MWWSTMNSLVYKCHSSNWQFVVSRPHQSNWVVHSATDYNWNFGWCRCDHNDIVDSPWVLNSKNKIRLLDWFRRIVDEIYSPRPCASQLNCVVRMCQWRPNVNAAVAVIVIVMAFVPSKSIITCWPEFSPHKFGTFDAPPDTDMISVSHIPSPFGGANDKSRNSIRNWQTVELHGLTLNEHLISKIRTKSKNH